MSPDPTRISRTTITDLAALLGVAVLSNAEMDRLLYQYGFDIASAPVTIKHKANHLVFGINDSTEIDGARREQILLELATYALRQPRGGSTSELVSALGADGFRWDGERIVPAAATSAPAPPPTGPSTPPPAPPPTGQSTPPPPTASDSPLVFVSYAHESSDHVAWVIRLATDLRSRGINVTLDKWAVRLGGDLAVFMEQGVSRAKRVLLILTPEYRRKADSPAGGVGYERTIITAELMKHLGTIKFVGIVRSGTDEESVPTFLGTRRYADFRDDSRYADALDELVGDLLDQPIVAKPFVEPGGGSTGGGSDRPPPGTSPPSSATPTTSSGGSAAAPTDDARFKMVIDDYERRGTPKNMIDSFTDLSREEKAELYDRASIWKKGRPSKHNPYR